MEISAVSATFFCFFPAFWAGLGCCLGDLCGFSYFFPGLFRIFGWVWGAVWGISAVSATFSCFFRLFSGFLTGFGVLFCEFMRFQLLFPALLRILGCGLGCCFANFCGFSSTRPAYYATNLWLLYIMII